MNENVVALIPARSGSKGLKNKNIADACGKPLIAHTIESALKSNFLNGVYVSTDSSEIANISEEYGATIPFLRPKTLAEDTSTDDQVIEHFFEEITGLGQTVTHIVYLRPTIPRRPDRLIDDVIKFSLKNPTGKIVRTFSPIDSHGHPYWTFKRKTGHDDIAEPFVQGIHFADFYQRQKLPRCYRINGAVDILNCANGKAPSLLTDNPLIYLIEQEILFDIDTLEDLENFKFFMEKKNNDTKY